MADDPNRLSRRSLAAVLGRTQPSELFANQAHVDLSSPTIPRALNLTRPIESLEFVWRGRVVIAVANYTAVAVEAPQTIIQRLVVRGTHVKYGQQTLCDLTGATLFAWTRLFRPRGASLFIGATRQAELSSPMGLAGATFGNTGTFDVEVHYELPFTPVFGPQAKVACVPFWLQPSEWGDSLQIQLFFGDKTSFGTPGGSTTVTFSAIGGSTGTPSVDVLVNYGILGPLQNSVRGGLVIRSEAQATGAVAAVANGIKLASLAKQKTPNVIVKSGQVLTGTSAGVSVFSALKDDLLSSTVVNVDNKPVRNSAANYAMREFVARQFQGGSIQGYLPFTWIDSGDPRTMYRGDRVGPGSTFELVTNILTAYANPQVNVIQEQVFGRSGW